MRGGVLYLSALIVIGAAGFGMGWFLHPTTSRQHPLPILGRVPEYTLTDQLGHHVSSQSFRGKVRVVTFLFPYCRGYCPLIAHDFVSLGRLLQGCQAADDVQLIAFNVDPAHTGPAQMKAFQEQYGWDPNDTHWEYMTGPLKEIRRIVTDSYHVYFKKVSDAEENEESDKDSVPEPVVSNKLADKAHVDYDIVHNDVLAIVDTDGRIRKLFDDAEQVSNEQIMNIINQLLPSDKKRAFS